MKKIESLQNPRIKHLNRIIQRKIPGYWIIEGKNLLMEALDSEIAVKEVFVTDRFWQRESHGLSHLEKPGCEIFIIPQSLMQKISDVSTPSGIMAVAEKVLPAERKTPVGFAALLFSIRDPGNIGTLIRSAEATGCDFIAYTSDCADPYQSKAIRASAGSIFRMPLVEITNTVSFLEDMKQSRIHTYALFPSGGENLFDASLRFPALLVIGSESHGLPEGLRAVNRISIPMAGKVESLNAATAGAICFYRFGNVLRQST